MRRMLHHPTLLLTTRVAPRQPRAGRTASSLATLPIRHRHSGRCSLLQGGYQGAKVPCHVPPAGPAGMALDTWSSVGGMRRPPTFLVTPRPPPVKPDHAWCPQCEVCPDLAEHGSSVRGYRGIGCYHRSGRSRAFLLSRRSARSAATTPCDTTARSCRSQSRSTVTTTSRPWFASTPTSTAPWQSSTGAKPRAHRADDRSSILSCVGAL